MTEFNTQETPKESETADVKPTTDLKPPQRTKKAPKETETGEETPIVLANLTVTQNRNTKEPETIDLGNGIIAINR